MIKFHCTTCNGPRWTRRSFIALRGRCLRHDELIPQKKRTTASHRRCRARLKATTHKVKVTQKKGRAKSGGGQRTSDE